MTSSHPELNAFRNLLAGSSSRRDIIRAGAIAASAASMPLRGIYAQDAQESSPAASGQGQRLALPLNPYGQAVSVDPHRTVNWGPYWVFMPYAWSGLLRFDENGAVEADLAEAVEPNEDGSVWTATLREGIAFANGDAITADHVIASWQRALDSTQLSPMARFFYPIQGAEQLAAGENVALGVRAVDDRTIEIVLNEPLAYFPSYLATFGFAVVHPQLNAAENGLDWAAAASGPWSITAVTDTEITMAPNPGYWDEPAAAVSELVWQIAPGGNTDFTILDWYQSEAVAVADAPLSVLATVREDEALSAELKQNETQSSVAVLALDFHQAPFNDVRVRRAVAAAVNRETWANEIQQGTYVPANSFSPPVLAAIANYQAPTDAFEDDVQAMLTEAGYDPAQAEDEIILFQSATDSMDAMDRTAQLVSMIQDATGLIINHDTALTAEQITAARQDAGGLHMTVMQWQLDTDQPTLLGIAAQESDYNAGWINWEPALEANGDYTPGDDAAAYDELIKTAAASLDEAERNAAYTEAETLLLKNAVVIPLGFWNPQYLQKPWLTGTRQGPWTGSTPLRIDAAVTIDESLLPAGTPAS